MEAIAKIFLVVFLGLVIAVFTGFPIMWLWNWLMPVIFGLKTITFWQAVGLAVLCNMLFNTKAQSES